MEKQLNGYADTLLEHVTKVSSINLTRTNLLMCMSMQILLEIGILTNPWMMPTWQDQGWLMSSCMLDVQSYGVQDFRLLLHYHPATEAEYYALSTATREVIPIMELAKEM